MKSNGTPTETLLDPAWRYEANPAFYDEALDSSKPVRPHWLALTEALTAMGHAGLAKRWQQGLRMIHDNGITYNVYSDPQSTARPWPLDPIPLVMDPGEWKNIEAAIIQRAMLFNAMLADLYGPQELLREHKLPARAGVPQPRVSAPLLGHRAARRNSICTCTRRIWRARPTGNGGCCRIARRPLPAPVTRSKIAW